MIILISADAEWQATKEILSPPEIYTTSLGETFDLTLGGRDLTFFHGGWGKISAAASAQYVIDNCHPHLLVNLGTCGGFTGRIATGTILLVEKTIVYDILEQMSDPDQAIADYTTTLDLSWLPDPFPCPVQRGPLVSADRDILPSDIPMLASKYGAVAADWESGAIAWVANRNRVRCLILRGVTDLVGEDGGEAYGDIALFHARTRNVMRVLLDMLPQILAKA